MYTFYEVIASKASSSKNKNCLNQISAKFLKVTAPVIAIHLAKIISLSIKLDIFPSTCNITNIKPLFKRGIKTEAKIYRLISFWHSISKVIEK